MGNKKMKLGALAVPFNTLNKNKRIYTKDSFSEECLDNMNERIKNNLLLGELKQAGLDWKNPEELSISACAHIVTKVEIDERGLNVEIELLETYNGNIANKIIEKWIKDGGSPPFSITVRGIGNMDAKKNIHMDKIISFDLVPSFESSFDENTIIILEEAKL